jgi:hypothetical protein
VDFINSNPKCNRRKLIESLAPSPAPAPIPVTPTESGAAVAGPSAVAAAEPTPEQTALIADLHWLVHQGHVMEFANGQLDTAKKPIPRPPKSEAKPATLAPAASVTPEVAPVEAVPAEASIPTAPTDESARTAEVETKELASPPEANQTPPSQPIAS